MSFQWLEMRITEEKDRRERESQILERLPRALEELRGSLTNCVDAYARAFGSEAVALAEANLQLVVSAAGNRVEVVADPELPGFQVRREGTSLAVRIGVLPGDRLFYLDVAADQYLSMDELTRKILDRVLFPKLKE